MFTEEAFRKGYKSRRLKGTKAKCPFTQPSFQIAWWRGLRKYDLELGEVRTKRWLKDPSDPNANEQGWVEIITHESLP